MAAPQRRRRADYYPEPRPRRTPVRRTPVRQPSKSEARRRRAFLALVVVPVLLMMGSVYTHAAAANLGAQVATLEERGAQAASARDALEIRLAELSAPDRVRTLAAKELGMREPGGEVLKVYGGNGEDKNGGPDRAEKEISR